MPSNTLSVDDRLKLAMYASNLKLSAAICYNPEKFYTPMRNDETPAEHNTRLLEYREALVAKFNAIQTKIKAKHTYRYHKGV